jgi:hypothetical protein
VSSTGVSMPRTVRHLAVPNAMISFYFSRLIFTRALEL